MMIFAFDLQEDFEGDLALKILKDILMNRNLQLDMIFTTKISLVQCNTHTHTLRRSLV